MILSHWRTWLILVWFLSSFPFFEQTHCAAQSANDTAKEKWNLVAIVTDDQGRWGMGAYGNEEIHTPNMDRIAAEGALFTNAFVATPVCSPSRAVYLTGRWPSELGITDWIAPNEAASGLGLKGETWPQLLQKAGYQTALIGKWHLGEKAEFHPTKLGFHHFMGFLSGGNRPMNPTLEVEGKLKSLKGPLPDLLTKDAIQFVRKSKSKPFALCLHYRAPHTPYGPVPKEDSEHYQNLDPKVTVPRGVNAAQMKQWHRAYYASISSIDRNMGKLLKELDDLDLTKRTLLIFTSDHGYNLGRHTVSTKGNGHWVAGGVNGPKRANMWDTSIQVPLAIRWPGVVAPGTIHKEMVSHLDMFRTILGALNVPVSENAAAHGMDFSPLLRGESFTPRKELFGQYDLHNGGLAYLRMIRTDRYKYVKHYRANMMDEMYDLQADPNELKNLLSRRSRSNVSQVSQELARKLLQWQTSIKDPLLKEQ